MMRPAQPFERAEGRSRLWGRFRTALVVVLAGIGCLFAILSIRSFFMTDRLVRFAVDADATFPRTIPPPPEDYVQVSDGLHIYTVESGRGRLQFRWQENGMPNMVTSFPRKSLGRWSWSTKPAEAPWSGSGRGWDGWSAWGVGVQWTNASSNQAYKTRYLALPLPILAVIFWIPLIWILFRRRRNRQRHGFAVEESEAVTPSAEPAPSR